MVGSFGLLGGRPPCGATRRLVRELALDLGIAVPVTRVISGARTPFVYALGKPVLVLDDATDRAPRRPLVEHELMHLKRRDHLWAHVVLVARLIHWWNPVFVVIRRELERAAELACDAGVVRRRPRCRMEFARALLEVAERAGAPVRLGLHAVRGRTSDLAVRLEAILEATPSSRWTVAPGLLVAVSLIATLTSSAFSLEVDRDGLEHEFLRQQFGHESYDEMLSTADAGIAAKPDNGIHWHERALALFRIGRLDESEAAMRRQIELGYRTATAYYNLACLRAHRQDLDSAFRWLDQAIEAGWHNPEALRSDPDLALLRVDSRFGIVVERLQQAGHS